VIIYDNFLSNAEKVAAEFPAFNSDAWFEYNNPIEVKKTCNNWHHFGPETYKTFQYLLSREFTEGLEDAFGVSLIPDLGLHGGGLHTHARGGKLNVHLDYDIHPKLELQRYVNLIIYLTPGWKPEWGGGLGMWEDPKTHTETVFCKFNRAVLFETKGQWHGLPDPLKCPEGVTRNSIAVYYLTEPEGATDRKRALFVPSADQIGNPEIQSFCEARSR
jgi:Rps23 Pro-64 3,4-dihydroxylase Tpa1-like proline 4-hydroxylase